MPTKLRITAESYSASSTAGSDRLNHCCKSKCAASAPRPPADARCRPSDSGPRSGRTACPKEPPAPSPPKTMPAASACCNAQSHSSSPVSSASYWRDCTNIHCGKGELNQSLLSAPHIEVIEATLPELSRPFLSVRSFSGGYRICDGCPILSLLLRKGGIDNLQRPP